MPNLNKEPIRRRRDGFFMALAEIVYLGNDFTKTTFKGFKSCCFKHRP